MAPRDATADDSQMKELSFDGVTYILSVSCVRGDRLEVLAERKEDAFMWSAAFPAKYVEEITAKTGSFKRFAVFAKMLLSALRQESESVYVDLLTCRDLQLLRSKRDGSSGSSGVTGITAQQQEAAARPAMPGGNKRYLILTYAAEFDRVHYPLPLHFEEQPDPRRLQATISQLRAQLAAGDARSGAVPSRHNVGAMPAGAAAAEVRLLRGENAALREQLQARDESQLAGSSSLAADVQQLATDAEETAHGLRGLRRERDSLLARLQQAEAAMEGERSLHRRELRQRGRDLVDLTAELAAAKDQIRELRLRCRELSQELEMSNRCTKVACMSAGLRAGQPSNRQRSGRQNSRSGGAVLSQGTSPSGSRYHSRDASPAPSCKAHVPGLPRCQSADGFRRAPPPSSRPGSAGRFDPTEYIRGRQERERETARRMEERRRAACQQLQGSRGCSLRGWRPPSMPGSRQSTPERSRAPSRNPSVDRARPVAANCGTEGSRALQGSNPKERSAAVRSTERLRATAVSTSRASGHSAFPSREQRAASPGRALLEVEQRLQRYAGGQAGSRGGAAAGRQAPQQQGTQQARVPPAGDALVDASAEIASIDGRLQSLQNFLRSAKGGEPAAALA